MRKAFLQILSATFFLGTLQIVAPAGAQTLKQGAPDWGSGTAGRGFGSCQAALDAALDIIRTNTGDPLIVDPPNCAQARQTNLWFPPNFQTGYRLTTQSPEQGDRVFTTAFCDTGEPIVNTTTREVTCPAGDPHIGKIAGRCEDCERNRDVGNPIDPGFGNKLQVETDYVGFGPFPLRFERTYNSLRAKTLNSRAGIGTNWTHTYDRRLTLSAFPGETSAAAMAIRPDGKQIAFGLSGGNYLPDPDLVQYRLVKISSGWQLTTPQDEVETYDNAGVLQTIANRAGLTQTLAYFSSGLNKTRLQSVTDPFGRTLAFGYNNNGLLTSLTIPGGGAFGYAYNVLSGTDIVQPVTVTDPMGRVRTYIWEGPIPGGFARLLTGITDELGVRYATFSYDMTLGSATAAYATGTQHYGGADKVTISYSGTDATVTTFVTASVSSARTYTFSNRFGVPANNVITGAVCPTCGPAATSYNGTNGFASGGTDWNGNRWNRGLDTARNLETGRFEGRDAIGTVFPETIYTYSDWHSTFRLPTVTGGPLRVTTNAYDATGATCGARGALCSKSVQATTDATGFAGGTNVGSPRVTSYTYNSNGQVLTANGPRTDVTDTTTYTYYANNDADVGKRGNVATVTNALDQTTSVTAYNIHGQPLTIVDPNGLTTTLAYDGRQRFTSRNEGGETTTYEYDLAGQLTKVALPDGSFLSYGYDGAHRLTSITDNLGNKITYTLDLAGNRTAEEVRDPANTLLQTRTRVYSSLNRLFQEIGAAKQVTEYGYDNQGNVLTVKDPLNHSNTNQYDRRNRLKQVTDPLSGVTQYGYNGLSALTSVKDPRNLTTTYALNGHGDLNTQVSPDTGTTVSTYDLAGNLATQTDAKNQVTTYTYDALNRVTLITFHDGSTQAYGYDSGTNGIGRLTSITEKNPSAVTTSLIAYGYDLNGRVTSEARTVGGITYTLGYSYTNGQLTGGTYPSGRTVAYSRDSVGRINQVTTATGSTQVVVENVAYHPFGTAKSWNFGNGQTYARTIDQDGRIASYTLGGTSSTVAYDSASRIAGITPNTYGYDSLDRLNSATLPSSSFGYSYDAVGNRLTKVASGNTDTYTYSGTSNRIATLTPFGSSLRTFTLDPNGSTISDAVNSFVYDTRGRMVQSTNAASLVTTYQVNALGQRIRKTNSNEDTVFVYDTLGKLIAENDASGTLKREFIYLGDIPVGVVQGGSLAFIHLDHLNSPRAVYDDQQREVWRWDNTEPFGDSVPNENPSGQSVFEQPIAFAGTYRDKEIGGKFYNWNRTSDPALGRYLQSDPMGLNGGLNTYLYLGASPLSRIDLMGFAGNILEGGRGRPPIGFPDVSAQAAQSAAQQIQKIIDSWFCPPDCADIQQQIDASISTLRVRYLQMTADVNNLYCLRPTGKFSWFGHQFAYSNERKRLEKLVAQAKQRGCPYDPEADEWIRRDPPSCPAR